MWKGKYWSMDNTKYMEKERENSYRKLKRSSEERHTETYSKYIDGDRCLSQSEESKCMWTHSIVTPSLPCVHIHLLSSDWERHLSPLNISNKFPCVYVWLPLENSSIFIRGFPFLSHIFCNSHKWLLLTH
jgi:hypothetical protein